MTPRLPRVPEAAVQRHIVATIRTVGGEVWEAGTRRSRKDDHMGTRQTPGIPDLMAFLPPVAGDVKDAWLLLGWRFLFIECKAQGGRLRPEQARFRELCRASATHHIVGGLDEVIAFLVQYGYLKRENVPHYRLPEARA